MKLKQDDLINAGAGLEMLGPAHFSTRPMIDDGWRIPDAMWQKMKRLLPPRKVHPLSCHNPRVPDRAAMNAILLVWRTGCEWTELDSLGLCSHSAAHRRFQEWVRAGVFEQFRIHVLLAHTRLRRIDRSLTDGDEMQSSPRD